MRIKVSQLRRIIKEEVSRSLNEIAAPTFRVGDVVRSSNPRIGAPLYGKRADGTADVTRKIGELAPSEDATVLEFDPTVSPGVLLQLVDGSEKFVSHYSFLVPASGPARTPATGKEFLVTFIGARGGARNKIIVAKDAAEAEKKAQKFAKLGDEIEIDGV